MKNITIIPEESVDWCPMFKESVGLNMCCGCNSADPDIQDGFKYKKCGYSFECYYPDVHPDSVFAENPRDKKWSNTSNRRHI